jgi:hypothetical protein
VPSLVINSYAKQGYIDHQTFSFDACLKFIEDDFLGGQHLDPKTDSRTDPRPDVRENASQRRPDHSTTALIRQTSVYLARSIGSPGPG